MYATLLSMQKDDIVNGLESLTRKAQEIVLGKPPAATDLNPPDQQLSSDDPPPTIHSTETIIPPAANSHATPMLFS